MSSMQLARVLVFAALLKLISGIGTCSPPWTLYSSNCYLYAGQKKTWLDANDICLKINAQLPMVKTDSDWTALNSFRSSIHNSSYDDNIWLSATANSDPNGRFQWFDKSYVNDTYPTAPWFVSKSNYSKPEPSPIGCRYCCPWLYCDVPGACAVSLGTYDIYNRTWATASCDSALFEVVCVKPATVDCPLVGVSNGKVVFNGPSATVTCTNGSTFSSSCSSRSWNPPLICDTSCRGVLTANTYNVTFNPPVTTPAVPTNTTVTVNCSNNFALYRTISSATCSGGSWYPAMPLCLPKCQQINDPYGTYSYSDPTYYGMNSQATLTCSYGYVINGSNGQLHTSLPKFCDNSTWIGNFSCQSICKFNPCLNNGTCSNTPNFTCACQPNYSGTYCEIYHGPCDTAPTVAPIAARKKRWLLTDPVGALETIGTAVVGTVVSTVNSTVAIVSDVGGLLSGTVNGLLAGNITAVLTSVINPLADILKVLVNDLVINTVVKGLLVPVLTSVIPINTTILCIPSTIYTCDYGPCLRNGTQTLNTTVPRGAKCDPIQPLFQNCVYIDTAIKVDTTTEVSADDPGGFSPNVRLAITAVEGSSCAVLIGLLAFTLGVFILLRVFTVERIPQMCQEISLLIEHILILTLRKATSQTTVCIVTSVFIQYFTLTNFLFMILEALQVYCVLQNVVSVGGFFSRKVILLIGWGIPAPIVTIMGAALSKHYPSEHSCWLNLDEGNPVSGGTVYPVVVATGIVLILTEGATLTRLKRLPLTPPTKKSSALVSQQGLFLIVPLNIMAWVAGMYAAYSPKFIWLYAAVSTLNILLGVFICIFHISGSDTVHDYCVKLWKKLGCGCCCRLKKADN